MDIQDVITACVINELEENIDLRMPHKFKALHTYRYIKISGPQLHKNDDCIIDGIFINMNNTHRCSIRCNPFEELNISEQFEYIEPDSIAKLLRYIEYCVGMWECWWSVLKEEREED